MDKIRELIKKDKVKRILILVFTFSFIYFILTISLITKKYNFKEGEIAKVNIKAPREVKDEYNTKLKEKQAMESVPLQYMKKPEIEEKIIDNINSFWSQFIKYSSSPNENKDKIIKINNKLGINASIDDLMMLSKCSPQDLIELQKFMDNIIAQVYDSNIMENNKEDIKKAQEKILIEFNTSNFPKNIREIGTAITYSLIKPNLFYDEKRTQELKEEAANKVKINPITIKKDQIVVKEGEPITKYQLKILENLGLIKNGGNFEWYIYINLAIMIIVVMFIQNYYMYKHFKEVYYSINRFALINILSCVSVLLAKTVNIISPFLIPMACVPMLLTLLINERISITISIMNCIFIGATTEFNIQIIFLCIINAVLGAFILKKFQQRNDIIYSAIYIAIINGIMALTLGFLLSNNVIDVLKKSSFALTSGILSAILAIGILPIFESTFDIVTTVKLLELSNPNNPLLKRLLMEAPGTYHHSLMVANLAEVAAEKVKANPVLARVCAYYHDVGKIKRPYFFKENQMGNENPHDKITPNLSTLIITSHVKDGVELAKEYKLPKVIQDGIIQHHGTSLVKYFYITAKNSSEKPEEIKEEDFKYPGPIPLSKEAAIIMLADGVEAAVRSIPVPTKGKIEEMVNNIIKARLNEGQLDSCDLTLKDLDIIRQSFLKVLSGVYHKRIEYPEEKIENNKG